MNDHKMIRLEGYNAVYPSELGEELVSFVEKETMASFRVKVDAIIDFGSHSRGEALPDADYDLFLLFHSVDPEMIVFRKYSTEHQHFLGREEKWKQITDCVASGRNIVWWPYDLDDVLDKKWNHDHEAKISILYMDIESFTNILLEEHFVLETLSGACVYDPNGFYLDMKRVLAEEINQEGLIHFSSRYANPQRFRRMVDHAEKWNVPRNWSKMMMIGLRRSLAALLLFKEGELSFRVNHLVKKLGNDLDNEELNLIKDIYNMAFSIDGVQQFLSRWQTDKKATLSEMKEHTENVLVFCDKIRDLVQSKPQSTQKNPTCLLFKDIVSTRFKEVIGSR